MTDRALGTPLDYRKQLMKRALETGFAGFMECEMVEFLLALSTPREDVRRMARALLARHMTLKGVQEAPVEELLAVEGMNVRSAVLLKTAKDACEHFLKQAVKGQSLVRCGPDFINYCRLSMSGLKDEHFKVAFLNVLSEIIDIETISTGTVDQSVIYPRKVMERALHHNAVGLIFVHNHPGGSVQPSYADRDMNETLVAAASVMDMEVYDHIIIGGNAYFSFRDSGLMSFQKRSFAPVERMVSSKPASLNEARERKPRK